MASKAPPTKPPVTVPIPAGFRRATAKEITPKVLQFARTALTKAQPIGKQQTTVCDGKLFMALTEWHYDDHVGQPGKPFWHPGISIFIAKDASTNLLVANKKPPVVGNPLGVGNTDLVALMNAADTKVV